MSYKGQALEIVHKEGIIRPMTPSHKLYSETWKRWVTVAALEPGEVVACGNGQNIVVVDVRVAQDEEPVGYQESPLLNAPQISWVKNDPKKHTVFEDGSTFLVALRVNKGFKLHWEFDVVKWDCDGEGGHMVHRGANGIYEAYDVWEWEDFEYFYLIEGSMPTNGSAPV